LFRSDEIGQHHSFGRRSTDCCGWWTVLQITWRSGLGGCNHRPISDNKLIGHHFFAEPDGPAFALKIVHAIPLRNVGVA
jgi:hypothetical protein